MKNGTASRGKLCVAVTIFWIATVGGIVPVSTKTGNEASASAKATGMPDRRNRRKRPPIRSSISFAPGFGWPS